MALIRQRPFQPITPAIFILFLSSFVIPPLHGVAIDSQDVIVGTNPPTKPEGKQGILEIPKTVATVIRNYIDSGLQTYLQLTTPKPNPQKPPELTNSIIGHYLLGGWYETPAPAPAYNPEKPPNVVSPLFSSNEPTYSQQNKQQTSPPAAAPPPPPPASNPIPEIQSLSGQTSKPRTRATTTKTPVHVLDAHPGIYNAYENGSPFTPDPDDEVYFIGDPTKPSVIIPIPEPTTPRPQTTTTVKSSTDGEDGGNTEEETSREDINQFNQLFKKQH